MKKKTKMALLAGGVAAVLIAAIAVGAAATSGNKEPVTDDAAAEEQASEEAVVAEWLQSSSTDVQTLAATLCASNWRTPTNEYFVELNLDGTYRQVDASNNEKTGTWRLYDLKASSSSKDFRNCTAVMSLNDQPCTFTSQVEVSNLSAGENMTETQSISASGLAGGKQLIAVAKDLQFILLGTDGDLAQYIGDAEAFRGQFASFCLSNVPLAQQAGWNHDLKIDYEKGKAQATFTCNDSKSTKVYATFPLGGGNIALSTSSGM